MTTERKNRESLEDSVRSCYSTWGERYYDDYYKSDSAYPPVHTQIIRDLLQENGASSVLDAGCGPASMLRDLVDLGLNLYGFDLTPEMVTEAQKVLRSLNINPENVWLGSVLDKHAYSGVGGPQAGYEAGICFGVFPHISQDSDRVVLENLIGAVSQGGLVAIEARNELFSLFTLNRYSYDFFKHRLVRSDDVTFQSKDDEQQWRTALTALKSQFRMDLPPVRKGYSGEPGYDEVLSRTHNPFELKTLAQEVGLIDVEILFYHYHALPPMMEEVAPELFRRESLAIENPRDWRGHFMASAFILVGRAP